MRDALQTTVTGISEIMPNGYPNGYMWTGNGPRSSNVAIKFPFCFLNIPSVTVSLMLVDTEGQGLNTRLRVFPTDITQCGFLLSFSTYSNSKVATSQSSWTAVGKKN